MIKFVQSGGIALLLACVAASDVGASERPYQTLDKNAALDCENLPSPSGVVYEGRPSWVRSHGDLPDFCQVRGTIESRIAFEIRLPVEWNGRFLMAGCGGFCGKLMPDKPGHSNAINVAVKRGYAAISHDGGHRAESWQVDWAYRDREALEIFGHRVLPMVAGSGVEMVKAFYHRSPDYKYFSGCSNGGRLGFIAAQRYPELFDGIAAGGSLFDMSGTAGLWGNWMITHILKDNQPALPQQKTALLKQAVLNKCDSIDGLIDDVVSAPQECSLDFDELRCEGDSTEQCLTKDESERLNRLYGGVKNGRGETVYPAIAYGSEHYADKWLFGTPDNPAWGVRASEGYRQLLSVDLFGVEQAEPVATDEMLDWISKSSVPAVVDAVNVDLSGLRQAGGKLMIYHGWSDPLIIPEPMLKYYEKAARANGGMEQLKQNARLFMLPGWGHCWEKPADAPDEFDPLQVLERWVEQGKAPDHFVALKKKNGQRVNARPICAYPATAMLIEGKNPSHHESYQCVRTAM